MKKVVQFGAGNIGRGFLGQLFNSSGYEIVFVDIDPRIINSLNQKGSYRLKIVGDNPQEIVIDKVKAINAEDVDRVVEEIRGAELLATAVGAKNLPSVAHLVAKGIEKRAKENIKEPINLIICENLPHASKVLKKYLLKEIDPSFINYLNTYLGLVESVVSRMVPVIPQEIREKDPTFIMAEEYSILPVDKNGFKGKIPKIKGIIPYPNLFAYEEQKLFTHNTGHAVCAYLGYQKGYRYIWESIQDNEIRGTVENALTETSKALVKKHHFKLEEQQNLVKDLLHRFANKALGDTVIRVGRDPIRKLGPNDRLIGAAKLALKYEIAPVNICRGIAAAIFFDYSKDPEAVKLVRLREKEGVDGVLKNICQIDPRGKIAQLVKKNVEDGRFKI